MGNARAARLCVVSWNTVASSSNPSPCAPGMWRSIQYSVLPEPAKGSITNGACLAGAVPATAAISLPIASPSPSRVHSTAVRPSNRTPFAYQSRGRIP